MGARFRAPNFIIETPDPRLARQIGQAAEKYRRDLAVAWLGKAMPNWAQPCVMTVRVGPRLGAGGATTFVFNRGEVYDWRMTIQGSEQRILDSVLPHEITHMIYASRFRQPVPRWADEGGATSVEHASERAKHRKMLSQFLRTGRGIAFNRMFAMTQYPPDIMPLYAQGYSVAEFLIQTGGRRKYVDFMGDGMDTGDWSGAIRRHYDVDDIGALQGAWLAWVQQGWPAREPATAQPSGPAATPSPDVLAGRLPRPEPNLIYHMPEQPPQPYTPGSVKLLDRNPASMIRLASITGRPEPKLLPSSGWRAAGTGPPQHSAAAVPSPAPPVRSHLTRPQQYQRAQQSVLEWSAPK